MVRSINGLRGSMATTGTEQNRRIWRPPPLISIVNYAVSSHKHVVVVLLAACLLAFVPGFFQVPPVDRDEPQYAQATKQMVDTRDFIDIRFQNEVQYKKPVGIYWLQSLAVSTAQALGKQNALTTIWLYRLPSLIGAIGAVLLTYWAALAFVSRRAAVLAALMMATSVALGLEARLAKTDAMLLLTTVAAMGAMARAYLNAERVGPAHHLGWLEPIVFWTALAGGILLKGPVIVVFVGLTILTLVVADRSARWLLELRPAIGIVWLLVLVVPWFMAIANRGGDSFFTESLGRDLIAKVLSAPDAHGAPPGYHFLLFWVMFWPGATLAAIAAPSVWAARREKGARFLLAWVIPAWIVFELAITKLPHYLLPLYPAIAILIVGVMDPFVLARERWLVRGTGWWFVWAAIMAVGSIGALIFLGRRLGLLAWPFAAGGMMLALYAWRLYPTEGAERSLLRAMAAAILIAIAIHGFVLPAFNMLFPSAALARVIRASDCPAPAVAVAGYHEPSVVFLVGTETRLIDGSGAADFLRQGPCRYAFVESRQERSFLRRADAIGLRYSSGQRIEGFNAPVGQRVSIAVYRSENAP